MDHISKAVERAKQQKLQTHQRGKTAFNEWVRPGKRETEAERLLPKVSASTSIMIDEDVLRSNCILISERNDDPVVVDKYRVLRTRILQLMKPNSWTSLGITSPGPKAGKTTTAINLALSMARDEGAHVVLIDADLRKPSIDRYIGYDHPKGLVNYLASDAELNEIICDLKNVPNLSVIFAGSTEEPDSAPELLSSPRLAYLLSQLKDAYENLMIVLDLPPTLVGDDVLTIGSSINAFLFVVEEGGTDVEELVNCVELLNEFNLVGTVLNKSAERPRKFEGYYHPTHHDKEIVEEENG